MADFESAYQKVSGLVREFEANESYYVSAKYQESEVRTDFIDKFWIALGWDVRHKFQTNPREQEVKVERNPDSSASNRKADYAFYLKPQYRDPAFFVEAKKPSRKLADTENYFQTVRYGYNASTPVAILMDFEEFHIIDCRYEPNREKSFPSAQIKTFHYKDYLDREKFGEIYWLFSHEALEGGKLKDFVKDLPKQRGKGKQKLTAGELRPVDEGFLIKLEEYRLTLAKAFKKADESLTAEVLTEATQKVIDRLVFIRFLEDKAIEADYIVDQIAAKGVIASGAKQSRKLNEGSTSDGVKIASSSAMQTPRNDKRVTSAWQSFVAWSKELDVKYNGVVFKAHDIDKPSFKAPDDEVFRELCEDISHTRSHYLFSLIPIEILGSIYERFLGKVVTATAKRADIEEKPEVRKAGGVYYTPKYIVDYIVANTVGKLIEGRTPKEIAKLRFADIACGSGSFLIAVYDTVLHYVEKYYNEHKDEAAKAGCVEIDKGVYTLSLKQKQRILLDNIFGVDIDRQAVEVAQLSLFLKLLENESGAGTGQLTFEKTKILPDLSKNIVNGNSLVEYDISDLFPLSAEDEARIKPFDFRSAFKEVMASGGFDAIVGNPPYGAEFFDGVMSYLKTTRETFTGRGESYLLFAERAIYLLKKGGKFGYIIPDTYLNLGFTQVLRQYILKTTNVNSLLVLPSKVFNAASVDTSILIATKNNRIDSFHSSIVDVILFDKRTIIKDLTNPDRTLQFNTKDWFEEGFFNVESSPFELQLIRRVDANFSKIADYCEMYSGIKSYEVGKGSPPQTEAIRDTKPFTSVIKNGDDWSPLFDGKHIGRYVNFWQGNNWIKYGRWLAAPREPKNFVGDKILIRKIVGETLLCMKAEGTNYCNTLLFILKTKSDSALELDYFLGILNSRFIGWYFRKKLMISDSDEFPQIMVRDILTFPIPKSENRSKLISNVNQMLETKKRLAATQRESEREQLERKCDHLDHEIDRLVYDLYGLTEEEIKIVEES